VTIEASCDRAPARWLTALCENPPAAGRVWEKAPYPCRDDYELPREVQRIARVAVEATEHVRAVPNVQVLLATHSPESMTLRVRFWHAPAHRAEMRSACVCALVDAFETTDATVSVIWTVPPPPLSPAPPF
jgi:hypothetical protein